MKNRQNEGLGINRAGIRPQVGQARLVIETKEAKPEQKEVTRDDLALVALDRLASRQGWRACQSLRLGKATGKAGGWRMPVEVSATSQEEAIQVAKYESIKALHHAFGEQWPVRVQWLPEFGPFTRRQMAFRRWLALTAWRGAYNDVTQLPGGVTGRRAAGVRALFVDIDDENKEAMTREAMALFAPDSEGNPWLAASERREAKREKEFKRAKLEVFRRYLKPFAGKGNLTHHERQAKLVAIRRARIVSYLLEGQGTGMRSDKLGKLLKPLGFETTQGKRTVAASLARMH
jgi:hypothetical protein